MQVKMADFLKGTNTGDEVQRILKKCVHCGFCNATCPTFSIFRDELDSPRGRIYQIKNFVESGTVTESVQLHLDRCLTCLSCTTTCPSGVEYNKLIDIGRELVEQRIERPLPQLIVRWLLHTILPYRRRFAFFMSLGRACRFILPRRIRDKIPKRQKHISFNRRPHPRKMLILEGCVQPTLTPKTNQATKIIFDQLGIEIIQTTGSACCGAVSQHLMEPMQASDLMRQNIDAWWPAVEAGAEAILVTASGCGVMVKDYAWHLRNDSQYKDKAQRISQLCKDPVEILSNENLNDLRIQKARTIAFQSPCSLQHGQRLDGRVEAILMSVGFNLVDVNDAHLCCGSAGTYSVLQGKIANQLRIMKLDNLQKNSPELIATANVGCQIHLQAGTQVPVVYWLELLAGLK